MKWRSIIPLLGLAALTGCGPKPAEAPPPPQTVVEDALPAEVRYVGMWAVSEALCDDPAWRFEERAISTQGEVHCEFTEVNPSGHGYAVSAMCTAEAPPAPFDIRLEVTDAPRAMVVSGGPWMAPTRLIYCEPLPRE